MMNTDLKHWQDNLAKAKQKSVDIKKQLQVLFTRQFLELSDFLEMGRFRPRFDLKKLPIWGDQVEASEINFEWPKMDDL